MHFPLSNKKQKQQTLRRLFFTLFFGFFLVMMLVFPTLTAEASLRGILLWATVLLPTIIPFMFFTKLMMSMGDIPMLSAPLAPLTKRLWRSPPSSAYLFMMSLLSGYPMGAYLLGNEVRQGSLTEKEAKRICSFTSTSGPMFLIGSLGVGLLVSPAAGYILFAAHLLGTVLNGILWARIPQKKTITVSRLSLPVQPEKQPILASVEGAFVVGGYVCVFSVITAFCMHFGVFSALLSPFMSETGNWEGLLAGILEITNGTTMISASSLSLGAKIIACEAITTFGGLSVLCQSMTFLKPAGISIKWFLGQKITQVIFSCVICLLLVLLCGLL